VSPKIKSMPVSLSYKENEVDSYDLAEVVKYYDVQLGVPMDEIIEIRPSFVEIPGYVYTERGIAKPTHPLMGSIGVYVMTEEDRKAELQIILYHDRNPGKTHCGGFPHWNQEIRIIDPSGKERRFTGDGVKIVEHVIPDSPYLEVYCLGPDGELMRKRTNRDDFRP
jgi:hypothetical protein